MLKEIIEAEINEQGPIRLDRYMALCLSHPEHGYYMQRQPFGKAGDFTTAPEISQMFGELVGLWLVQHWLDLGSPSPFVLVELGPGRGTLMADILRIARTQPAFLAAANIFLMESSPRLQQAQKDLLAGAKITHLTTVDDIPDMPMILIANEFFDALPIRQFLRNDFGWQERLVGKGLQFCLSQTRSIPTFDTRFANIPTGTIVETSASSIAISNVITKKIMAYGGGALIVDYGSFTGVGDTFQAVSRHQKVDPFAAPGLADLTAHVRFSDLVQNQIEHAFTTQGEFLLQLGIEARSATLAQHAGPSIIKAKDRLVGDREMGRLFKLLAMSTKSLSGASGFCI